MQALSEYELENILICPEEGLLDLFLWLKRKWGFGGYINIELEEDGLYYVTIFTGNQLEHQRVIYYIRNNPFVRQNFLRTYSENGRYCFVI